VVEPLYLVVRRAASAHHLSFPYAGKDFVHPVPLTASPSVWQAT
jgi:hypothetical protein